MRRSLLMLSFLTACAGPPEGGQLPTPFTAAEIREANPPGTMIVSRRTEGGAPPDHVVMRFQGGDHDSTVIESWVESPEGDPLSEPVASPRTAWTELRDHARFDPGQAVRARASCVTPGGEFVGWLYTVLEGDTVRRLYFADTRPGPPVRIEILEGGRRASLFEFVAERQP